MQFIQAYGSCILAKENSRNYQGHRITFQSHDHNQVSNQGDIDNSNYLFFARHSNIAK